MEDARWNNQSYVCRKTINSMNSSDGQVFFNVGSESTLTMNGLIAKKIQFVCVRECVCARVWRDEAGQTAGLGGAALVCFTLVHKHEEHKRTTTRQETTMKLQRVEKERQAI